MTTNNDTLPLRATSAWNQTQAASYLSNHEEPLRLSLIANGAPLILPLWFIFENGGFYCASPANAYVARLIANQPDCGFDISGNEMPYCGIRGQGKATIEAHGEQMLERLADRYLKDSRPEFKRWLLSRQGDEIAIRIVPTWATAWDFSSRM